MESIEGGYINYSSSVDDKKYLVYMKYIDTKISDIVEYGLMEYIPDIEDFIEGYEVKSWKTLWEMIKEYDEKEKHFYVDFIYKEDILKCYLVLRGYIHETTKSKALFKSNKDIDYKLKLKDFKT